MDRLKQLLFCTMTDSEDVVLDMANLHTFP